MDHVPALHVASRGNFVAKIFRIGLALCCIARDNGQALCHIVQDKHIFVNFSVNSKQKYKILYSMLQCKWPMGNRVTKKLTVNKKKSRDTVY
jgi:hypothetical protein